MLSLPNKRIARNVAHAALAAFMIVGVGLPGPLQDSAFALLEILNQDRPESSQAHTIRVARGWIS